MPFVVVCRYLKMLKLLLHKPILRNEGKLFFLLIFLLKQLSHNIAKNVRVRLLSKIEYYQVSRYLLLKVND